VRSDGYHFVDIADLSFETVRKITPDVVLSDPVESSGLIVQEVTRLAPSVDFEILELTPELLQTMAL